MIYLCDYCEGYVTEEEPRDGDGMPGIEISFRTCTPMQEKKNLRACPKCFMEAMHALLSGISES